ncbi:sugar ABC transporter substrate-binding protein [Sphingopyxis sp.]|uniref:ABC transporter substrate-binding protein n=1 Tax=Sphingopyxis sp. TaxID=1908224 RepID=UPI002D803433|nr:sugar ABC transporter substrate-binding protein [Sphingopyxis sp.]
MRAGWALLAAVALSGCASDESAPTTLTIATVNNGDMVRLKSLATGFETSHPRIKLKWVVLEENILRQKVTTDVAIRGGQYDVVMIGAYEVPIWAKRKWLQSLDDLGPAYEADDLIAPVRAAVSYRGVQYAAPFNAEGTMIMYRTDLFRRAGLTMPAKPSWEDLARAAAALNDPGNGIYGVCLRGKAGWGENMASILTVAHSYGARLVDDKWRPQFDTPEWRKAIDMYVGLLRNWGPPGAAANGFNENLALFSQGRCAIWFDSTVAAPFLSDPETSKVADHVGFAPAPDQGLGRSANWLWTWAFAIPASSKKAPAAKEFIGWAAGPGYASVAARQAGWLAVPPGTRLSLYRSSAYRRAAPFADVTLQSINAANPGQPSRLRVPYIGVQYAAIPEWQGIGTEIGQQFSAAIAGRVSTGDALAEAQAATRRQLTDAGYYQ